MVTATVKLWDRPVGVVAWDAASALASFEYFPEFIASGWDIAPLTMPLREAGNGKVFRFARLNTETYHGLPGLLADSLPDHYGTTLIDAWLAGMGRSADSLNPVERLCYIGKRGMGALEFEPALKTTDDRASTIEIAGLVDLAREILSERTDFKTRLQPGTDEGLEDIIKVGTSAGGARPKAIIAYNEQTNEVRSGQVAAPEGFSHWLLKFDGIGRDITAASQGYGRIEYAYYRMALDCGITMQECRLYEENGRAHFMTRRFDREGSNGKWHTQTLCAMKHYDFKQPALYAYEQAFQVMRELRLPYSAAEEYYRRMVFNVMARNCDDHTKNTSFLMDRDGQWSLAPAYDMSHAFNPGSIWLKAHNMTINGKKSNMDTADLLQVAREMNIKKPAEIIRRVSEVVRNWKQYASDCGVRKKERDDLAETHLSLQI